MICLALALTLVTGTCNAAAADSQESSGAEEVSQSVMGTSDTISYKYYQKQHEDKEFHKETVTISPGQVTNLDGGEIVAEYFGKENVILTSEQGQTDWEFVIDESGIPWAAMY